MVGRLLSPRLCVSSRTTIPYFFLKSSLLKTTATATATAAAPTTTTIAARKSSASTLGGKCVPPPPRPRRKDRHSSVGQTRKQKLLLPSDRRDIRLSQVEEEEEEEEEEEGGEEWKPVVRRNDLAASPVSFESPSFEGAKEIFDSLLNKSGVASLDCNGILHSYCNSGASHGDAARFLSYMSSKYSSFTPDRSSYHILLVHACLVLSSPGDISITRQVFDTMSQAGFRPTPASADIAIRSLCSADRGEDAVDMIRDLALKHSTLPDDNAYNVVIKRLCKPGCMDTVYQVIEELQIAVGLKPNSRTYSILIGNLCKAKNMREVTRLLGLLKGSGMKPDIYLYNTIMKGYCRFDPHSFDDPMILYSEMKDQGVEPNLVTYNRLILALSKAGRVDQATKFLRVMMEMGHFPDTVTCTSLMNEMCRIGDALGAVKLLREMKEKGCQPSASTYSTLIVGLCKKRGCHLDEGLELFRVMTSAKMKLDAAAYGNLIRALIRAEKVAEAYDIFDYVLETKSLTDVEAYLPLESSLKWLMKFKS